MPLTEAGKKTLAHFKKEYGDKEGESNFYAAMNAGTIKRSEMEETTAKSDDLTVTIQDIPKLLSKMWGGGS